MVPFSSSAKEETYLVFLPDGKSFQTTRKLYELINLLDGSRSLEDIALRLSRTWECSLQSEDVRHWVEHYILPHELLTPESSESTPSSGTSSKPLSTKGIMLIPDRFLLPVTRPLRVLFHPLVSLSLLWASAICHGLFYLSLSSKTSAIYLASIHASVYLIGYLLIFFSALFHELGHLAACQYLDCPHGEIRLGLYLLFPVLYANVSSSWRLNRRPRVVVDLAGMYFQLILTIPVFLLFQISQEEVFLLLFLELDTMICFCLNPFLRFDGYWLCSDLLGVPNLRSRSQRLVKMIVSRLVRRPFKPPGPLMEIRTGAMLGLAFYAIGSYVFAGLVLAFFCRILAPRIEGIPSELKNLVGDVLLNGFQGNTAGMLARFIQLLFLFVTALAVGRMLAQAIRSLARASRYLLRKLLGALDVGPDQG